MTARTLAMFAGLTDAQLEDITDSLCVSVHWARRTGNIALAAELQTTEHVAWHALCVRRGVRCLQDK